MKAPATVLQIALASGLLFGCQKVADKECEVDPQIFCEA